MNNIYDFSLKTIDGKATTLGAYKGRVLLLVNTASKCGLTPQYEGLENLYKEYKEQGLEVLGFPANNFLAQEPGTSAEIQEFCQMKFGIDFPLFQKISVKGSDQHPLYRHLTETKPQATVKPDSQLEQKLNQIGQTRTNAQDILWNFEKFLISRDGKILGRFAPDIAPTDSLILDAIRAALKK